MKLAAACVLLCVGVVTGCSKPVPLETRVRAYWEARRVRDFTTAYALENPSSGVSQATYIQKMAAGTIVYESVRIQEVQEDGVRATVKLHLSYRIPGLPKAVQTTMSDPWTRVGREWVHDVSP